MNTRKTIKLKNLRIENPNHDARGLVFCRIAAVALIVYAVATNPGILF